MVQILRITKFIIILVFSLFFLWFSYVSISLASIPLRNPLVNEKEKISALGLVPSVPTEYLEDGSLFWWITEDGMVLNYTNNINETVVGRLNLYLSGNPCKYERTLKVIENGKKNNYVTVKDEQVIIYTADVALEPFEKFVIFLEPIGIKECYVKNGDSRNFIGRLDGWIFE